MPKGLTPSRRDEMSRLLVGGPRRSPPLPATARNSGKHRRGRAGLYRSAIGALVFAAAAAGPPAAAALLRLRCTNPASGTNWAVVVDLNRSRVDSLPATITEQTISWHDPKQGFFDLDRASGRLEFRNASSTGGYFLHYTCRPE